MTMLLRAAICGAAAITVVGFLPSEANAKQSHLTRRPTKNRTQLLPSAVNVIMGGASTYNPFRPGYQSGGVKTASGEDYDPATWTAAIQTELRALFGGVLCGKSYRPAFALVETEGKRAVVRINDVGPLKPGRVIDLNEHAMRYFDPSMRRGVLSRVKITPLRGAWTPGPINEG
jgi:peptidoglycan lytic transglycosylase